MDKERESARVEVGEEEQFTLHAGVSAWERAGR